MDLIPEKLRRALEDREVVFFCGAGASKGAGLPSFEELVESILTDLLPSRASCKPGSMEALTWENTINSDTTRRWGFWRLPI